MANYLVKSVVYTQKNTIGSDEGVYLTEDDNYIFTWNPNYSNGDVIDTRMGNFHLLRDLGDDTVGWEHAVGRSASEVGALFYFWANDKYYKHYVEMIDGAFTPWSTLKEIKNASIFDVEYNHNIDLNDDGYAGAPPPVIKKLLHQGQHEERNIYITTEDRLLSLWSGREFSAGEQVADLEYWGEYYEGIDYSNFSADDLVGQDNSYSLYFFNSGSGKLYRQDFSPDSKREANEDPIDVTNNLEDLEKATNLDFDSNGRIGPRIPLVEKILLEVDINKKYQFSGLLKDDEGNYRFFRTPGDFEVNDEIIEGKIPETFLLRVDGADSNVNLDNAVAYEGWDDQERLLVPAPTSDKVYVASLKFKTTSTPYYFEIDKIKSYESDDERVYEWEQYHTLDLNNDNFLGPPVRSIKKVIFNNNTNGSTFLLDDLGYYRFYTCERCDEGDDIDGWSQVVLKDGLSSEINFNNALAKTSENNGFLVYFKSSADEILVQKFKKLSDSYNNATAYAALGEPKSYDSYDQKVLDAEKSRDTDLNNDGFIGKKDVEIKEVLLSDYFYSTQDNDIIMVQEELEEGDTVSDWFRKIIDKSGDPFDFKDGIRAFGWTNNGFSIIYKDKPEYKLQSFKFSNDIAAARGNARKVTSKIQKYEEDWYFDIDGDSEIGVPSQTVRKIIFKGDNDQWIYESFNGSLVMAEENLAKGDFLDDENQFFDYKENGFEVDGEIRAYSWQAQGPFLIYKKDQKYKLQFFRERNGNFTANGKPRDITKRIEKYENELVIDINKDGTFGEKLVEVSKVLFSGLEGYEERGIYRASNNDLVASEPELEKGDVFNYETTIVDSDGDPFEPGNRVAGVRGARGGFSLIYQDGIKFYEQLFRESRDIARQNGKKRDVTKKIFKLEDELGIDLNKDGSYGDEAPVIQNVLFDGTQGFDYRGVYRLQNGSLIVSDSEMEKGDTPSYYSSIVDGNGDPFDPADRVAAIRDSNRGFSLIYQDGNKYLEQIFKEVGDFVRTNGKPKNITQKIKKLEDELGVDINLDNRFGKEPPSIKDVYFDGVDGDTDTGVYSLNTGELIAADSQLEAKDTPRDYLIFVDKKGGLYDVPSSSGPSGLISAKGGFGLVYSDEGKFYLQQFRKSKDYLRINGNARDITKQIFKMEDKEGIDFNRDFVYGKGSPVIDNIIYDGSDNIDYGVYRMDDNDLIVAESDLDKGDVPFAVIGTLRSSKKSNDQYDIEAKVVGAAARDGKYYLFLMDDAKIIAQSYESAGNGQYLMEKDSTNITSKLEKYEQNFFMDFDGNGMIGEPG